MIHSLILCYHAASPDWPADLATSPERMHDQISRLIKRGMKPVSLSQALEQPAEPGFSVTFDDAFLSVLERGLPVLSDLGVPATVFAPTAYVGSDAPMAWPGIDQWVGGRWERELTPMNWDQLRGLRDLGWEIGSHTHTHPRLTTLGDTELASEMATSREILAQEMGEECSTIAYPYGDHDDRVVEAAAAAGYRIATTLPVDLRSESPLRMPRVGIYNRDHGVRFRLKTSRVMVYLRRTRLWRPALAGIRRPGRTARP